jgi:hypothetical protein
MKVLFSTFNLYKGGSLTLYKSITNHLVLNNKFYEIKSRLIGKPLKLLTSNCLNIPYPTKYFNPIYRFLIEQFLVPAYGYLIGANKVVMMGNFPSFFWFRKQSVLFHNTLYLNSQDRSTIKFFIEKNLFKWLIKFKNPVILVQTKLVASLLEKNFSKKLQVRIIGFPGSFYDSKKTILPDCKKSIKLIYPAFFYPHKNHNLILRLRNWLLDENIKIYLTFDAHRNPETIKYTKSQSEPFEFIGQVSNDEIKKLYTEMDGLLFLSQEESLGIPLLEAVEHKLPIIAPLLPYVNAAVSNYYMFDLLDDNSLIKAIKELKNDLNFDKALLPSSGLIKKPADFFKDLLL